MNTATNKDFEYINKNTITSNNIIATFVVFSNYRDYITTYNFIEDGYLYAVSDKSKYGDEVSEEYNEGYKFLDVCIGIIDAINIIYKGENPHIHISSQKNTNSNIIEGSIELYEKGSMLYKD